MADVVITQRLTAEQARELTDEARGDAAMLWAKLYALHEGGAHLALGYTDWGAYCEAEFGWSQGSASRLLSAGRVRSRLERANIPIGILPDNESVARELSPVLHKAPEQLDDIWAEAVATAEGETPTAVEVQAIVDRRAPQVRPRPRRKARKRLGAHERRLAEIGEYTEQLRGIEKLGRSASTRLRNGHLAEIALDRDETVWLDLLRRAAQQIETAQATLAAQLQAKYQKGK